MASRVVPIALLLLVCGIAVTNAGARQPPSGTAMYVSRHDPRLCPSPYCGGYWVAIANGARTRCSDGLRRIRCYVARAVDAKRRSLGGAGIAEEALVRGAIDAWQGPFENLDQLLVTAVYAPAGSATVSGGYYRVVDTGIRCVRAPCFSFRATQVNGSTRITISGVDLAASGATAGEVGRAQTALRTKDGLYARGRFVRTTDGGLEFRALRLYLRAPLPRS
jgi:hypothetical protein